MKIKEKKVIASGRASKKDIDKLKAAKVNISEIICEAIEIKC
jgi:hypothetical protein